MSSLITSVLSLTTNLTVSQPSGAIQLGLSNTPVFSGAVTAAGFISTGGATSGSAGQGILSGSSTYGAIIGGSGGTYDVTLANKTPSIVMGIPTGTLNVSFLGGIGVTGAITGASFNGLTITTSTGTLTMGAKTLTVSNTLTLAGTDATTMTFPTTSATIARTDASNTFTGHQTIEGVTSTGATGTGKFVYSISPTITGTLGAAAITATGILTLGSGAEPELTFNGSAGAENLIVTNETNTGTGLIWMQSGGGSAAYGGGLRLYANAHASHPGDVVAAISTSSGGSFRVNSNGDDSGSNWMQVTSTGINSTAIGATTASTGAFTTLAASGTITQNATAATNTVGAHFQGSTTGSNYTQWSSTGGNLRIGIDSSPSSVTGDLAYGGFVGTFNSTPLYLMTAGGVALALSGSDQSAVFNSSTASTSTTTGAVTIPSGGLGVGGAVWVAGTGNFAGNLTVGADSTGAVANVIILRGSNATNAGAYINMLADGGAFAQIGNQNILINGSTNNLAIMAINAITIATNNGFAAVSINTSQAVQFNAYGAGAATFDSSGNITSVSDLRMKENIRPFARGLEALRGFRPILFNWNEESGLNRKDENAGFGAQHLLPFLPEAVGTNDKGVHSLIDRAILATHHNAILQLDTSVSGHETRIAQLEKENLGLREKLGIA